MSETIEVYFKNENDAESAQAQLRTLKINQMYLDEMPEDTDVTLLVPYIPTNIDANTTGSPRGPIVPIIPETGGESSGSDYPNYLLHVEVETDDYEKAMSILQNHEYYMRE